MEPTFSKQETLALAGIATGSGYPLLKDGPRQRNQRLTQQQVFACCLASSFFRRGLRLPDIKPIYDFVSTTDLQAHFDAGRRLLVIAAGGEILLASPEAALQPQDGDELQLMVIDLQNAHPRFISRIDG